VFRLPQGRERNTAAETAEFVAALIAALRATSRACSSRPIRASSASRRTTSRFLGRQRGLQFETFATEQAAVAWLERS
jgi:hypothetical protein